MGIRRVTKDDFRVFVAEADGSPAGYTVAFVNEYPPLWTVRRA